MYSRWTRLLLVIAMVKCAVIGCRSGYAPTKTERKLQHAGKKCVKTFQCSPFPSVKGKTCETRGYVRREGRYAVTGIPTTAASASCTSGRTTSWTKRSGRPNDSGRL